MSALHATARPEELVPGDDTGLEHLAATMRRYGDGCADAARTLRTIDDGAWVGEAADVFRSHVGELPGKLQTAASAFGEAGRVLDSFVTDLHLARQQARRAIDIYAAAEQTTHRWQQARTDYRTAVEGYRRDHPESSFDPDDAGLRAPAVHDPGAGERLRAERLLSEARADVDDAAQAAARALRHAGELAPDEPGLLSRAVGQLGQFFAGAGEALYGLAEFAFKLSPAYLLIDPEGYVENAVGLGKGLVYGLQHPKEFGKALLDWDTWAHNPARALGHLVPDLLLALATGGAGTAAVRGARASRVVEDLAAKGTGLRRMADAPASLRASWAKAFPEDPAAGAKAFQGKPPYAGVDDWAPAWADRGHQFSAGTPGAARFAVPRDVVEGLGGDARRYYEGVQVRSRVNADGVATYRDGMRTYEVQKPMPLGVSVARNNPQFGGGGLPQYFTPDELPQLVDDGYLRVVDDARMSGTISSVRPDGLPGIDAVTPRSMGQNVLNGTGGAAAGVGLQGLDALAGADR